MKKRENCGEYNNIREFPVLRNWFFGFYLKFRLFNISHNNFNDLLVQHLWKGKKADFIFNPCLKIRINLPKYQKKLLQ